MTTIEPVEIIINQTQEAVFTCHAYGIPVPNITWIKSRNGSIVTNISNTIEISESVISNTSTRESILTFIRGLKTDESVYTCKGSNGITNIIESTQEDNVTLLVQGILSLILIAVVIVIVIMVIVVVIITDWWML